MVALLPLLGLRLAEGSRSSALKFERFGGPVSCSSFSYAGSPSAGALRLGQSQATIAHRHSDGRKARTRMRTGMHGSVKTAINGEAERRPLGSMMPVEQRSRP